MASKNYYQHRLLFEGKEFVDVETLAPILGLCTEQIRRLTRDGKIPAIKKGRRWWYNVEAVQFKRLNSTEAKAVVLATNYKGDLSGLARSLGL